MSQKYDFYLSLSIITICLFFVLLVVRFINRNLITTEDSNKNQYICDDYFRKKSFTSSGWQFFTDFDIYFYDSEVDDFFIENGYSKVDDNIQYVNKRMNYVLEDISNENFVDFINFEIDENDYYFMKEKNAFVYDLYYYDISRHILYRAHIDAT